MLQVLYLFMHVFALEMASRISNSVSMRLVGQLIFVASFLCVGPREHRVSVVDSLPRQPPFYEPILEFIKEVARQLHDPDGIVRLTLESNATMIGGT